MHLDVYLLFIEIPSFSFWLKSYVGDALELVFVKLSPIFLKKKKKKVAKPWHSMSPHLAWTTIFRFIVIFFFFTESVGYSYYILI